MNCITLDYSRENIKKGIAISLPASKSESNRLLILNAIFPDEVKFANLSTADDTQLLAELLKNKTTKYNAGPAGTVFRFLSAYLSLLPKDKILTGSERMKSRPIKGLVDALIALGAKMEYLKKEGYPPILIKESKLGSKTVEMDNEKSSQFVTALMLIAPALENGLEMKLKTNEISFSYIKLTAAILNYFGIETEIEGKTIRVAKQKPQSKIYHIESDWSSASYWFSFVAFSENASIFLTGLRKISFQGDAVIADIFSQLGVKSTFDENGLYIEKIKRFIPKRSFFEYDFSDCPDIAPTVAVAVSGLKMQANLTGLQTLNLKESKRIDVLAKELSKFGVKCKTTKDSLVIDTKGFTPNKILINTYHDHRIAMAFAPLVMLTNQMEIENPDVVKKSYPRFWEDVRAFGIKG